MEKLLLIGINTRAMVNSALRLNYEVFSTSYFSCYDMPKIDNEKFILHEKADQSSGVFEDNYDSNELIDLAGNYLDEVDYIIPVSGISHTDFNKSHQKKILGNKKLENVENKFNFYNKIKNKFNVPKTFKLSVDEAYEIIESEDIKQYIIKPLQGSGGYGVNLLNKDTLNQLNDGEFLLQEFVKGTNVSSSVLATKSETKTIINSRLLTENDFSNTNNFYYIGNIVPLNENKEIINQMNETSQDLISHLKLIGSNGVDYVLANDELYVIEVNPRLQGTYECCESVLGINMLEAHIKACQGELINIPTEKQGYSYKKIVYAPYKLKYQESNLKNLYDLPYPDSIIEKNEPFLTIIENNTDFEKLCENVNKTMMLLKNT